MSLRDLVARATPGPWRLGTTWRTIQREQMQAVEGADGRELGHSWFLTPDAALISLAPELALLAADAIPVLDELCAWVDTNMIGCIEVQERGEALLRKIRDLDERAGA